MQEETLSLDCIYDILDLVCFVWQLNHHDKHSEFWGLYKETSRKKEQEMLR